MLRHVTLDLFGGISELLGEIGSFEKNTGTVIGRNGPVVRDAPDLPFTRGHSTDSRR
jgi:hypothetical protein